MMQDRLRPVMEILRGAVVDLEGAVNAFGVSPPEQALALHRYRLARKDLAFALEAIDKELTTAR